MKKLLSILSICLVFMSCDKTDPDNPSGAQFNNSGCLVCDNYLAGESFIVGGNTYLVANRTMLDNVIDYGEDLTKYCTSRIGDMENLFQYHPDFNQDISSWDVSNVTNMSNMFKDAAAFNQDLSSWSVDGVTECEGFSSGATSWTVPKPNLPNCEPCSIYLDNNGVTIKACSGAVNGDTGVIDNVSYTIVNEATLRTMIENDSILTNKVTSLVTDMSELFNDNTTFNQDISSWDVSNVTNMEYMFYSATAFNQPIGDWDVSSVTNMESMFQSAAAFNQNLSSWNVDGVTSCNNLCENTTSWTLPKPNFTNCDTGD